MNTGTFRNKVRIGSKVAIVLKKDQRSGKLTYGTVKDILTNSSEHHRGIKVRLTDGQVGRIQNIVSEPTNSTPPTPEPSNTNVTLDYGYRSQPSNTKLSDYIKENVWSCNACTFQNSRSSTYCIMCETPRPSNPQRAMDWICTRCTLFNSKDRLVCDACGAPK